MLYVLDAVICVIELHNKICGHVITLRSVSVSVLQIVLVHKIRGRLIA